MSEIETIAAEIRTCQLCRLGRSRTHAVPGIGPTPAAIMFIGEAPGAREDEQGLPFVGPSGQLLEKLLGRIGLSRAEVFITNLVKCRPPVNRDPLPDEVAACSIYLKRQLALVQPTLVVTLGRHALYGIYPKSAPISKVHGSLIKGKRFTLLPVFHPAAALRSPSTMRELESDFDAIAAYLAANRPNPA
jgi:uracil-DNA glycosylase family 4